MNLFKRHIGRRVTVVGIGLALLMLGLEAPAFAAAPTVSAISPTSGRVNCIAVVTGTAFTDSPAGNTTVTFDGPGAADVNAPDFAIASATEIWVRAPALVDGTSYTITIANNGGTASGGTFLATAGVGGCAPTITSITPTCGSVGDKVVITGTNLLAGTDPTVLAQQSDVNFFDYVAATTLALHVVPNADTPTSLSVLVPSGAADGPIRVTTDVGPGFSPGSFLVPPPDCPTAAGHTRSISLKLKDKLVAKGTVKSTEATPFTDCAAGVPVKIQRKVSGSWKTVGKTTTSDTGAYSKKLKNKSGKYRSIAVKTTVATDEVCLKAKSPVRSH